MRVPTMLLCVWFLSCLSFNDTDAMSSGATPIYRPAPIYPPDAKRDGIEGYVIIEFTIETDGRTADILVVQSEPEGIFDNAAIQAVARWEYEPEILDDEPNVSRIQVRLDFELED